MWRILLLAALALPATSGAEVYRWVTPDGTVHYSDKPWGQGAKRVELPPLSTIESRTQGVKLRPSEPRLAQAEEDEQASAAPGYSGFSIATPAPDQGVRANNGVVEVALRVEPRLYPGHQVKVALDGQPVNEGRSLSFSIPNVARGTHTLAATVVDAQGDVVTRAPSVTFHVLRVALGGATTAP